MLVPGRIPNLLIMKSSPGPPMTLGNAAAHVRLIVWCRECRHQVEPDPAEQTPSAMFTETGTSLSGKTPNGD